MLDKKVCYNFQQLLSSSFAPFLSAVGGGNVAGETSPVRQMHGGGHSPNHPAMNMGLARSGSKMSLSPSELAHNRQMRMGSTSPLNRPSPTSTSQQQLCVAAQSSNNNNNNNSNLLSPHRVDGGCGGSSSSSVSPLLVSSSSTDHHQHQHQQQQHQLQQLHISRQPSVSVSQ